MEENPVIENAKFSCCPDPLSYTITLQAKDNKFEFKADGKVVLKGRVPSNEELKQILTNN